MTWRKDTMTLLRNDAAWRMLQILESTHAKKEHAASEVLGLIRHRQPTRILKYAVECKLLRARSSNGITWYKLSLHGRKLIALIKRFEARSSV